MSLMFFETADAVRNILIQEGASQRIVDEHRACRNSLGAYLSEKEAEFSEHQIISWLEEMTHSMSEYTVGRHRIAAYRILLYYETGSIYSGQSILDRPDYRYYNSSKPYVLLSPHFQSIFREYVVDGESRRGHKAMGEYHIPVSEFLLMLQNDGIASLTDIDISHIVRICNFFDDKERCDYTKRKSKQAVSDFLIHMCADCLPWCYRYYASEIRKSSYIPILDQNLLSVFPRVDKPSASLEEPFEKFAAKMEKRRYLHGFMASKKYVFVHFFLYLELNKIAFSKESIELWTSNMGETVNPRQKNHFIYWFYEFITYGTIDVHHDFDPPERINLLPDWSRKILKDFIELKKREGYAEGSIGNFRAAGLSLFEYLDYMGIHSCDEITPGLLMDFHKQDKHRTVEGKNTRSSKVRKILLFMAEEDLIPYSYAMTITTVTAPVVTVPQVLSNEMIQALYEYRDNAQKPLEYRNAAMIMLGLRMGFRASDVVNLRFENIDWKKQIISIVQKKTGVPIIMPMPTDVANSLYLYIKHGRHDPAAGSEGYVFTNVYAPHGRSLDAAPLRALRAALVSHNYYLNDHQGFHILRRNFATNLLRASLHSDQISEALGHTCTHAVNDYLSLDEERMRMCPLPFKKIGGGNENI